MLPDCPCAAALRGGRTWLLHRLRLALHDAFSAPSHSAPFTCEETGNPVCWGPQTLDTAGGLFVVLERGGCSLQSVGRPGWTGFEALWGHGWCCPPGPLQLLPAVQERGFRRRRCLQNQFICQHPGRAAVGSVSRPHRPGRCHVPAHWERCSSCRTHSPAWAWTLLVARGPSLWGAGGPGGRAWSCQGGGLTRGDGRPTPARGARCQRSDGRRVLERKRRVAAPCEGRGQRVPRAVL